MSSFPWGKSQLSEYFGLADDSPYYPIAVVTALRIAIYEDCFDKIIHFSFLCSSKDRELIDSLRQKDYRTTGVMQLMSSPTGSYDQAMIKSHLKAAKKIVEETVEKSNS